MLTILKPLTRTKPFNVKAAYRMYGFEAITPLASDTLMTSISYYARRGDVTYSITITPQEVTIGSKKMYSQLLLTYVTQL